ncbi:hypothetical protein [Rudanella lutea]|uniref:hypothetical protein n=1 Tax=Rudanella lutea TaxID=451374 RepID=UPI00037BBCEE|nr:hypothetical protein [Rudanella lutea]
MANSRKKDPIQGIAIEAQLIEVVSCPTDQLKLRTALRSWFMSFLTQTEDHINHSSLVENIYYYEVLQEWIDATGLITQNHTVND